MNIRKKKIYVYRNDKDLAITKAYSIEEAVYTFERQYRHSIVASCVKEAEFNTINVATIIVK